MDRTAASGAGTDVPENQYVNPLEVCGLCHIKYSLD